MLTSGLQIYVILGAFWPFPTQTDCELTGMETLNLPRQHLNAQVLRAHKTWCQHRNETIYFSSGLRFSNSLF